MKTAPHLLLAGACLFLLGADAAPDAALSAREIMERVDARDDGDNVSQQLEMVLIDKRGGQRVRNLRSYGRDVGEDEQSILFFLSPADVEDTGFLTYDYDDPERDDDQWLYLPALSRTKRIASSDKSGSFMGSDFTYADMADRPLDHYEYTLMKETEVDGHEVWQIESVPITDREKEETGYTKQVVFVRQDNFVVVRGVYFVKKGKRLKYFDVKKLELIDGIWTPTEMHMSTRKGKQTLHKTVLYAKDVKFNQSFSDELFTLRQLEKGARRLAVKRARRTLAAALFFAVAAAASPTASAEADMDDILGGFEVEDPDFDIERAPEDGAEKDTFWDLSGSVELTGSLNYLRHRSDTGTDYSGLQRLRARGNLQLDLELHREWQARVEGWGFIDPAYAINGRDRYTAAVRGAYESDAELGEVWLAGKLLPKLDLKLGRQVVIWGRSESLRVLDVLNPLDNREPGRVDLESLRRPVSMLRLDAYHGNWTATGIVIPEIRFDENPVVGSDFYPGVLTAPEREPDDFEDPEAAGAITGTFSGWDVSFQGAWFWNDQPRFARGLFPSQLIHDRLWMLGAGGNYTVGSWLLKSEVAYVDGLGFFGSADEKSRGDVLVGLEYYGFPDTTFVIEVVERHLFDYERRLRSPPDSQRRNQQEVALRLTRNFWNDTLHFTALGVLFGLDGHDGSVARADLEYDVADGIAMGIGILLYQEGSLPPQNRWGDNDRILFHTKWSF